jgi:xanthine dehydrogenase accessory factor
VLHELFPAIERWHREGKSVALATVVDVWGSAPRAPGARMAVSSAGEVEGSVSGGCVESAVVEAAHEVLRDGAPRLLRFGVSHEQAWAVGLSCGGTIEIFVESLGAGPRDAAWDEARRAIGEDRLVALATVIAGPAAGARIAVRPDGTAAGSTGDAAIDRRAVEAATDRFAVRDAILSAADGARQADLFVEAIAPRAQLVIIGAVHVAVALVRVARVLGFRTAVVDPRGAFATPERFPHADALIADWPAAALERIGLHESSYVVVLSHDFKIDVPALSLALRSPARYVGVLGSRRTHDRRVQALRACGHADEEIARIRSPIGLDLGARSPEEIAVAIAAEIVAASHGRLGR